MVQLPCLVTTSVYEGAFPLPHAKTLVLIQLGREVMRGLIHIRRHELRIVHTRPHLAQLFESDLLLIIIDRTAEAHVQMVGDADLRPPGMV